MHFLFLIYVLRDGRIWEEPFSVLSDNKKHAERIVRRDYPDAVHIDFKLKYKYDDYEKRAQKYFGLDVHEQIPSQKKLASLGIQVPDRQIEPYVYSSTADAPEPIRNTDNPHNGREFKSKKCEYCGDDVPRNGAAQFSHLRKHLRQLVDKGWMTKKQMDAIRSVTVSDEVKKLLKGAK